MVEEDKDHPNVTRAVLEVKKKPPILGDTIKKFRETFDPEEESQLRRMIHKFHKKHSSDKQESTLEVVRPYLVNMDVAKPTPVNRDEAKPTKIPKLEQKF